MRRARGRAQGTIIAALALAVLMGVLCSAAVARPVGPDVAPAGATETPKAPVTVTGTGFAPGATTFKFGKAKATAVACSSATSCTMVSPAHEAGTVDVTAIVAKAASPLSPPADQFTYS